MKIETYYDRKISTMFLLSYKKKDQFDKIFISYIKLEGNKKCVNSFPHD